MNAYNYPASNNGLQNNYPVSIKCRPIFWCCFKSVKNLFNRSCSLQNTITLHIPPVSELQHKSPCAYREWCRKIIICIYKKQIGGWPITPLQTCVEINII